MMTEQNRSPEDRRRMAEDMEKEFEAALLPFAEWKKTVDFTHGKMRLWVHLDDYSDLERFSEYTATLEIPNNQGKTERYTITLWVGGRGLRIQDSHGNMVRIEEKVPFEGDNAVKFGPLASKVLDAIKSFEVPKTDVVTPNLDQTRGTLGKTLN